MNHGCLDAFSSGDRRRTRHSHPAAELCEFFAEPRLRRETLEMGKVLQMLRKQCVRREALGKLAPLQVCMLDEVDLILFTAQCAACRHFQSFLKLDRTLEASAEVRIELPNRPKELAA